MSDASLSDSIPTHRTRCGHWRSAEQECWRDGGCECERLGVPYEQTPTSEPASKDLNALAKTDVLLDRTRLEKQIDAAHDAWERTVTEWRLRRVSNYGLASDIWLVERSGDSFDPSRDYGSEIAYYKFEGENAEQQAKFMLRDKCIKAALSAALSI